LIFAAFVFGVLPACGNTEWTIDQLQNPRDNSDSTSPKDSSDLDGGYGQVLNLDDVIQRLDVASAQVRGFRGQGVKIAILDNGFGDLEHSLGKFLPQGIQYEKNSQNAPALTRHGTTMAELVYAVATGNKTLGSENSGPELLLYNSNGFSNFQESVRKAIAADVDIILYAQVWEYGGNFDGGGFINSVVYEATNKGILWVNAAGNYRDRVWSGTVQTDPTRQLIFASNQASLPFRVLQGRSAVKASLAWNDFRDNADYATTQDIDLVLEDRHGTPLQSGTKHQSGRENNSTADWSAHAREIVTLDLESGVYTLKVLRNSDNFDNNSRVKVMIQGEFVELLAPPATNSILIPADNPSVITVGARDYDFSSQSSQKPEIRITSTVDFSSGKFIQGTSTAAAFAAAKLAIRMSELGRMSRDQAIMALSQP
jgi:hypothetical protein